MSAGASAIPGIETMCVSGELCERNCDPHKVAALAKSSQHPIWIHLNVEDKAAGGSYLRDEFGFHELAVEDALSANERPALSDFDDYIFLVAPAISSSAEEETYVEIGFFLGENYLVSVAEASCGVVDIWFDRWCKHHMPPGTCTADLLHVLIDGIVDAYLPAIDLIEDQIDDIADEIFTGAKGKVYDLLRQKRRLLDMRRRVVPLRDVVNGLLRRDLSMVPDKTRPYFQDVYDHASRVAESVDLQRDTLTSLLDVHLSVVSNNLNEVMKKMTVISTVLMTAALIAGIYGMNFAIMPELKWAAGYPFAIGLMVVSSLGILGLFKWKKWL